MSTGLDGYRFVRVAAADAAVLHDLACEIMAEGPPPTAWYRRWLALPDRFGWLALRKPSRPVGALLAEARAGQLCLSGLGVMTAFRLLGLGRRLVRQASVLAMHSQTALTALVPEARLDFQLFLKKCGLRCDRIVEVTPVGAAAPEPFYRFVLPAPVPANN